MKKLVLSMFLIAFTLTAAGCNTSDSKTTQNKYSDDGYMGQSTANPGILTSPNSRTYGNDAELVDLALKDVPHITRKSIQFRGGRAIVRIRVSDRLNTEEVESIRLLAEQRLIEMMPRYSVRVRAYQ